MASIERLKIDRRAGTIEQAERRAARKNTSLVAGQIVVDRAAEAARGRKR